MNPNDETFFKELGKRIAQARKECDLTQQQLAEALGIAQQTLAHYEVGRVRLPISMLPVLAQTLDVSLEVLLGQPRSSTASAKRGPASRLEQQIARISALPKPKQRFVLEMLETVLAQASR